MKGCETISVLKAHLSPDRNVVTRGDGIRLQLPQEGGFLSCTWALIEKVLVEGQPRRGGSISHPHQVEHGKGTWGKPGSHWGAVLVLSPPLPTGIVFLTA